MAWANWTFIVWGALNALYFLPLLLSNKNRANVDLVAQGKWLPSISEFFQMSTTFALTVLAWIFFRAENVTHAFIYTKDLFYGLLQPESYIALQNFILSEVGLRLPVIIIVFIVIEWFGREGQYAIHKLDSYIPKAGRWVVYLLLVLAIYFLGYFSETVEFIYFQF